MRIFTKEEVSRSDGRMCLGYGKSKVGKTTGTLLSAPDPIFYILSENRNLSPTLSVINKLRPDLRLTVAEHDTFIDTMEFLNRGESIDKANWKKIMEAQTIVFDSLTDFMGVKMPIELTDQAYQQKLIEKKVDNKELIALTKMSQENFGGLESVTIRLTEALTRFSRNGKYVIVLARLDQNPSWARHYSFAPMLNGKAYGKNFAGMFDLIGYIQDNIKIDDQGGSHLTYPAGISFESPDGTFMCGWTGGGTKRNFKLDWNNIFIESLKTE